MHVIFGTDIESDLLSWLLLIPTRKCSSLFVRNLELSYLSYNYKLVWYISIN